MLFVIYSNFETLKWHWQNHTSKDYNSIYYKHISFKVGIKMLNKLFDNFSSLTCIRKYLVVEKTPIKINATRSFFSIMCVVWKNSWKVSGLCQNNLFKWIYQPSKHIIRYLTCINSVFLSEIKTVFHLMVWFMAAILNYANEGQNMLLERVSGLKSF